MVEHSTHNPEIEGLNPTTGIRTVKVAKIVLILQISKMLNWYSIKDFFGYVEMLIIRFECVSNVWYIL